MKSMEHEAANARTWQHIHRVRHFLDLCIIQLLQRSESHDLSKLDSPEAEVFMGYAKRLAGLTYGSAEYQACLKTMDPVLEHHYAHNSHHPQHYPNGIDGMSLLSLLEMLCDWMAAVERHDDGDIAESLKINADRFGIDGQLYGVLSNTVKLLKP